MVSPYTLLLVVIDKTILLARNLKHYGLQLALQRKAAKDRAILEWRYPLSLKLMLTSKILFLHHHGFYRCLSDVWSFYLSPPRLKADPF
jgi:hypothetical protein